MKWTSLIIALLFTSPIFSQSIITDRPDQTESANTISKGQFQIETGSLFESGSSYWQINSSLFRCGISENAELRLVTGLGRLDNNFARGEFAMEDLQLGLKYKLMSNIIEVSYLGHLYLPTGSENIRGDGYGIGNRLIIAHAVTDNVGFGYNIGYNYFNEDDHGLVYTYSIGFSLVERVGFFIELYGHSEQFDEFILNFDSGFTFQLKENIQLDISTGFGLNHTMNFYSAGFSCRLPN